MMHDHMRDFRHDYMQHGLYTNRRVDIAPYAGSEQVHLDLDGDDQQGRAVYPSNEASERISLHF